ncbi:hypothetical protein BW41_03564 [Sphingomonas sp. RIT328]|nr:hypothetical protein BW41_03564 [Sphingomonas sp. RIT328]
MRRANIRRTGVSDSSASRCLALVFPWLAVDRLRLTRPHLFAGRAAAPVACVEGKGAAQQLSAIDAAAARLGLTVGATLVEALRLAPDLETFPADPHADMDWLDRLAEEASRYGDALAMPPDAVVVVIRSADERALLAEVEARLARRGVAARVALGDTPAIACALARHAGAPAPDETRAVRRLPVAALGLEAETAAALTAAGLRTIGEVMARPARELAAHFGAEVITALHALDAPARPCMRRAVSSLDRRFDAPLAGEAVAAALAALADEAAAMLAARGQGGRRWQAWLFRSDGPVRRLHAESEASRDVASVARRLAEQVGTGGAGIEPGYDHVRLEVTLADRLDAALLRLDGGDAGAPVPPVRRKARGGGRSVDGQAELLLLPAAAPVGAIAESDARPIHLFDPPQRIEGVLDSPEGAPLRFRWRRRVHDVARAAGPERIAGEWWRHDAAGLRDYYRIEDRRGRRLWIFHAADEGARAWYVHGVFA